MPFSGVAEVEREVDMVKIMIVDDHSLMRRAVREVLERENDLLVVAEASNGLEALEKATETQPDVILMDLDMPGCDGFEATERVLHCSPQSRVVIFTASHQELHVFQAIQRGAIGYITKDIEPDALLHAIRSAARNDLCIQGTLATQVLAHLRTLWQSYGRSAEQNRRSGRYHLSTGYNEESTTGARMTPIASYRAARQAAAQIAAEQGAASNDTTATTAQDTTTTIGNEMTPAQHEEAFLNEALLLEHIPTVRPLTGREREILDLMRRGRKNREIAGELCIAESTVHKHVQNIFEKLHARNRTEAIYLTSSGG